jgi:integrase
VLTPPFVITRPFRRPNGSEPARRGGTTEDLVFTDEIGCPLSPERVSAMFRRLVKATDLPPIGLHGLRHSFAAVGLDAGIDVLYIAEALGHASPSVTQNVYQHSRAEKRAAAITQVGDAIFGVDGQKTGRKSDRTGA